MRDDNPYRNLPWFTRWSKAVGNLDLTDVDPAAGGFPFWIERADKVATGGSCFAQHIARHLSSNGFMYYVVEPGHPLLSLEPQFAGAYNYGVYSARYGNIYTSRQLLQLIQRAFGKFESKESFWHNKYGQLVDPFRPLIQPSGFSSQMELLVDREAHLQSVRKMFETLDVFIFTLGLTECWFRRDDGTVLPVCPGVSGGVFENSQYAFGNLSVEEVVQDLDGFIELLRSVNSNAKIILTVSPVPLAATAEQRHVLVSTTYSKSVLRVAADIVARKHPNVGYFPSYEIITGNYTRGLYYAQNLRDVVEDGVSHVMRLFLRHVTSLERRDDVSEEYKSSKADNFYANLGRVVQTVCEEAILDQQ